MNSASRPALQAKTFAELTSAHGIGFYVQSSGLVAKLLWFALTLGSIVLAIFFTARIATSYAQPPFYSTGSLLDILAKYIQTRV